MPGLTGIFQQVAPSFGTPQFGFSTPAQAAQQMNTYLSSSAQGKNILSAAAYPKRVFPSANDLGLGNLLDTDALFPFKDNTVGLTDIEVPTTILVLGGPKQNQIVYQTNRFILQSIIKPLQERFQIIETFGEPNINFFDKRTRIYTIQGILFDAEDPSQLNNPGINESEQTAKATNYWATAFQDMFETTLRGTKLIQNKQIAALYINNWYIKGYPINLNLSKSSESLPQTVAFQMTWAIKDETLLSSKSAETLWKKNKVTAATMDALNVYLGALNDYQLAYNAYVNANGNPAIAPDDLTTLITKKDKAAQACQTAADKVIQAMSKDLSTSK